VRESSVWRAPAACFKVAVRDRIAAPTCGTSVKYRGMYITHVRDFCQVPRDVHYPRAGLLSSTAGCTLPTCGTCLSWLVTSVQQVAHVPGASSLLTLLARWAIHQAGNVNTCGTHFVK
jgi:hypothetical protein